MMPPLLPLLLFLAVPLLALAALVKLDALADGGHAPRVLARGPAWPWLHTAMARVRPWHLLVALGLSLGTWLAAESGSAEWLLVPALLVLLLLYRVWRHEFVALMACPDDAFPGRHDKLIWAALMVLLPPLGVSVFRAYRGVHGDDPTASKARATPAHDLF